VAVSVILHRLQPLPCHLFRIRATATCTLQIATTRAVASSTLITSTLRITKNKHSTSPCRDDASPPPEQASNYQLTKRRIEEAFYYVVVMLRSTTYDQSRECQNTQNKAVLSRLGHNCISHRSKGTGIDLSYNRIVFAFENHAAFTPGKFPNQIKGAIARNRCEQCLF